MSRQGRETSVGKMENQARQLRATDFACRVPWWASVEEQQLQITLESSCLRKMFEFAESH